MDTAVHIMRPKVGEVRLEDSGSVWVDTPDGRIEQNWVRYEDAIAYAEILRDKLIEAKSNKEAEQ